TYMNRASLATLTRLEQYLPVKATEVVGSSVDIFHKNPAHQQAILSDESRLPHRAPIKLGPETLDLLVSPIHDDQGQYIGAMATWEVITDKLRMERERQEAEADTNAVNQVLSVLAECSSVDEAVRSVLQTVRNAYGWSYGSYWAVDAATQRLRV